jgi:hypothetical protein
MTLNGGGNLFLSYVFDKVIPMSSRAAESSRSRPRTSNRIRKDCSRVTISKTAALTDHSDAFSSEGES